MHFIIFLRKLFKNNTLSAYFKTALQDKDNSQQWNFDRYVMYIIISKNRNKFMPDSKMYSVWYIGLCKIERFICNVSMTLCNQWSMDPDIGRCFLCWSCLQLKICQLGLISFRNISCRVQHCSTRWQMKIKKRKEKWVAIFPEAVNKCAKTDEFWGSGGTSPLKF